MGVKFSGPNDNFVPKVLKHGGDFKVGSAPSVKVESVNHDNFAGKKELADKNPGTDKQNHEIHGENPAMKGKLSGIHQPKVGGSEESVGKEEKLNEVPRAFKYNREGHAVENGTNAEQEHAKGGY